MGETKKVLIFAKRRNAAADAASRELQAWLKGKGLEVLDATEGEEKLSAKATTGVCLGVVIGGDGTFLTLVRRLEDKEKFPILGVNLGTLGFITETNPKNMLRAVDEALTGKAKEDKRPLLQVEICRGDVCRVSGNVFNDAVITKDARTHMLKFDVYVGDEFMSYVRADGYIIASPTGSTAYNLSAGGPLLHPGVNGVVVVPMCSHSLSARPIVVSQAMPVEIRPKEFSGKVYLVLDGQISHEIGQEDHVRVRVSPVNLRLLHTSDQTWFQVVRSKLGMS